MSSRPVVPLAERLYREVDQDTVSPRREPARGSRPLEPRGEPEGPGAEAAAAEAASVVELLAEAARRGCVEGTLECLAQGAPAASRDIHGWTALHYAAAEGRLEVCRVLLEFGGDIDALLPDRSTPLMLAVEEGHLHLAQLLLERGASSNCKDEAGFTALDRCAVDVIPSFKSLADQCGLCV